MLRRSLWQFFGLTFAITWGIAVLLLLFPGPVAAWFGPLSVSNPLFILAVFAPTLSAIILAWLHEGRSGLRKLLQQLLEWRAGLHWYLFVLLGIPALGYLAAYWGGVAPNVPWGRWYLFLPILLGHILRDPGPLGEELGWRGYALPELLTRYHPLVASLILSLIWFVWHLPAFFLAGAPQMGLSLPAFLFSALALSTLATCFAIRTGAGVVLSILLHLSANFALNFGAPLPQYSVLLAIAAVLIVLGTGLYHTQTRSNPAAGQILSGP